MPALGAFGKHPAWDDHTEFLGTPDETLVMFQRVLYQRGIAGNVESGAWERLEPGHRLDGFDHAVVWWRPQGRAGAGDGGLVVARMWSSVDGKGRARYPMVACVHVPASEPGDSIERAVSLLGALKDEVRAATSQEGVRAAVDRAGATASGWGRGGSKWAVVRGPDVAEIANAVNAAEGPQSFARAVYALSRDLPGGCLCGCASGDLTAAWGVSGAGGGGVAGGGAVGGGGGGGGGGGTHPSGRSGGTGFGGVDASAEGLGGAGGEMLGDGSGRAVTIRLPGGGLAVARALSGWLGVVLTHLQPGGTYLLIAPMGTEAEPGAKWVDLIVGDAQASNLVCLCASEAIVPMSSRVPYNLEPEFMKRVAGMVEQAARTARVEVHLPQPRSGLRFGGKARAIGLAGVLATMMGLGADRAVATSPSAWARGGPGLAQPQEPALPARGDSRGQYNLLLTRLREALAAADVTDDRARELVSRFVADVDALPGGVIYLREVDETIDALRSAVSPSEPGRVPADAGRVGPGMLSGTTHDVLASDRVRFNLVAGGGQMSIEFFKVTVPERDVPVWLSVGEVSAEQFAEIVRSFGSWEDLHRLMPPFRRDEDERIGPRVWQWVWSRRPGAVEPVAVGFEPAAEWLRRSEFPSAEEVYAPGIEPGRPTLAMPMQHVSPDAAVYAAQLIRCRLPSREEWAAAWAKHRGGFEPGRANLRDRTWVAQREHVAARAAVGRRLPAPEAGAFEPTLDPERSRRAWESEDGVLWLSPVLAGGAEGVAGSLAGNVSEFLVELPPETDVSSPKAVRAALDRHAQGVFVAGCSAIGPAGEPGEAAAVILSEAREGYADVGFRLAFSGVSEGSASLAQRLTAMLDPLPLLKRAQ